MEGPQIIRRASADTEELIKRITSYIHSESRNAPETGKKIYAALIGLRKTKEVNITFNRDSIHERTYAIKSIEFELHLFLTNMQYICDNVVRDVTSIDFELRQPRTSFEKELDREWRSGRIDEDRMQEIYGEYRLEYPLPEPYYVY